MIAWYVFAPILQDSFNQWANLWNMHYIRQQKYASCPSGSPNELYDFPYLDRGVRSGFAVPPYAGALARERSRGLLLDRVPAPLRSALDAVVACFFGEPLSVANCVSVFAFLSTVFG